jgi:hypothetical protein
MKAQGSRPEAQGGMVHSPAGRHLRPGSSIAAFGLKIKKAGPLARFPHCRLNCKALSYIRSFEQKPTRNYEKPTQYPQFEVDEPLPKLFNNLKKGESGPTCQK